MTGNTAALVPASDASVTTPGSFGNGTVANETMQSSSPRGLPHNKTAMAGSQITFMQELDRIQQQNISFSLKLEREKKRKEYLDEHVEVATQQFREAQRKTRDGFIVKENDMLFRKQVALLEQKLEATKVKISVTRVNNQTLRQKVMGLRKEKIMQLEILNGLNVNLANAKEKVEATKRETVAVNDKRQRTQQAIAGMKARMMKEIHDFSHDLSAAKTSVYAAQDTMLTNIRHKLQATMEMSQTGGLSGSPRGANASAFGTTSYFNHTSTTGGGNGGGNGGGATVSGKRGAAHHTAQQFDLSALLAEAEVGSLEELVTTLHKAEEAMFVMYNDMQVRPYLAPI
jgi:hypothetical protein